MNERLIVIDGNSLLNRAYYAMRNPMITKEGIYTQGIYGFLNMLSKIQKDYPSKYIAVAFDRKAPTFRHEKYDEYKAGRKKMPPELAMEFPILKDILDAMKIKRFELDGWEADDIIGTMADRAEKEGLDVLVITGDKDELQLASDKVSVLITKKGISEFDLFNENAFIEAYGFTPQQFIDYKALMGDSSDNYPGVPGIGEKTASKLITEYGSVDNIYDRLDEMSGGKIKTKLEDGRMSAYMSRELAEISKNVPVDIEFEEYLWEDPDYDKLIEIYKKLEFNSFLKKLTVPKSQKNTDDITVEVLNNIDEINKSLAGKDDIVLKIFHNGDHVRKPEVYGAGYAVSGKFYYTELVSELLNIIEDDDIGLIGHGIKEDLYALMNIKDMDFKVLYDTEIGEYVLNPTKSNYALRTLCFDYLGWDMDEEEENKQVGLFDTSENVNEKNAGKWCMAVSEIMEIQKQKIKDENMEYLLYDVEIPLVSVLARMEYDGLGCDSKVLENLGEEISEQIEELKKIIYGYAEGEFNINSPMQLGNVLFEKLGLPSGKKTKKGYSTSADVLEKIKDKHEIIPAVLEYRTLTKLKGTYVDGLIPLISEDGRIHAHFQQTVTATGRLSCTEPNLQNIPVKNEFGRQIRKAFIPKEGFVFEGADYSQIELRVLAHLSEDEELISAFNNNKDIHRSTAARIFGVDEDEVTPLQRSSAKAVNFGVIYGMSGFGLSEELSVSRKEAEEYINGYFAKYSNVKEYMDNQVRTCKETGYSETVLGRKRHINEITASNYMVRQAGERLAMNTPIQGSAADIIKLAMLKVSRALKEADVSSKLVLQIHDELIIETREDEVEKIRKLLSENMENAYSLKVKLVAEVNEGKNWYLLK